MHGTAYRKGVLGPVVGLILAALAASPLFAQGQISMFRSAGVGPDSAAISQRDLDRYAAILGLDASQKDAAKSLVDAYRTEFEAASRDMREKSRVVREEFQESRDFSVMEQLGPITEAFNKKSKQLESTLMEDMRALLTEQQTAQWPKVERTRRREKTISRGTLSGESVDLVRVVEDLELSGEARKPIGDSIEQYEVELDRALGERNKVFEEQMAQFAPTPGAGRGTFSIDMEQIQERMQKMREAGEKVREVNQRYARSLEPLLPAEKVKDFQFAVKRQSFPQVYRQSRAQRSMDAALKFDDLDERQKEAVRALRETYSRDAAAVNDRWADALVEEEKSSGGPMTLGGGGSVMILGDQENNDSPVAKARADRRELDKKTLDSLNALLTDPQKERLPKTGEQTEAVGAPGAAIKIAR